VRQADLNLALGKLPFQNLEQAIVERIAGNAADTLLGVLPDQRLLIQPPLGVDLAGLEGTMEQLRVRRQVRGVDDRHIQHLGPGQEQIVLGNGAQTDQN